MRVLLKKRDGIHNLLRGKEYVSSMIKRVSFVIREMVGSTTIGKEQGPTLDNFTPVAHAGVVENQLPRTITSIKATGDDGCK